MTGRMYGSDDVMSGFCDREDVWKCGVMSGFCDREDDGSVVLCLV